MKKIESARESLEYTRFPSLSIETMVEGLSRADKRHKKTKKNVIKEIMEIEK